MRRVLVALALLIPASELPSQSPATLRLLLPPLERDVTVPVSIPLPSGGGSWELTDGKQSFVAQADAGPGRLRFLLPVRASDSEVTRTFQLAPASARPAFFQLAEEEDTRLVLTEAGRPVLTYNFGMMLKAGVPENRRRSGYVHPLYAPDGTVLTDDFPADHYHHRGLSWMWPAVDVDGARRNLWEISGIWQRFEKWIDRAAGPVFARVACQNGWYTETRKVAQERVELTVYRSSEAGRIVDVTLTFEALGSPIAITGELPNKKGYGGLCLRFAPRKETTITTSAGLQKEDSNLIPFAWADLSARFGESGSANGAAIFVDARNPGFPNGWTLRDYGFLGVAWPGLDPYRLEPGRPVTLRYRIWVHAGGATAGAVEAQYRVFAHPIGR